LKASVSKDGPLVQQRPPPPRGEEAQCLTNDADRSALSRWMTKPVRSVKDVEVGVVRAVKI
jgi:hypothetical protein